MTQNLTSLGIDQRIPLRAVPNEWCKLVNTTVRPCPACHQKGVLTNPWHLLTKHNQRLSTPTHTLAQEITLLTTAKTLQDLLEKLPPTTISQIKWTQLDLERKPKRAHLRIAVTPIIKEHLDKYNNTMATITA